VSSYKIKISALKAKKNIENQKITTKKTIKQLKRLSKVLKKGQKGLYKT
jgi:hypothetical protein